MQCYSMPLMCLNLYLLQISHSHREKHFSDIKKVQEES